MNNYVTICCEHCPVQVHAEILEGTGVTMPDWTVPLDRRCLGCLRSQCEGCSHLTRAIIDARKAWEATQVTE